MAKLVFFFILLTLSSAPLVSASGYEELRILTSARITPPAVVERFERANNIRIRFEYFESPEAMNAYLQNRPKGDLALLRDHYVRTLIESNQLARLNPELLPNFKNIEQRARSSPFDPEGAFSVPYIRGSIGILFRRDLLGPDKPVWHYVFGWDTGSIPFALSNQYRDTMGIALIFL